MATGAVRWTIVRAFLWLMLGAPSLLMPAWVGVCWVIGVLGLFLRWTRPFAGDPPAAVSWLAVLGLCAVMVVAKIFLITGMVALGLDASSAPSGIERLARHGLGWMPVAANFVMLAPVVEEVAFRSRIRRALLLRFSPAAASAVGALIFAVCHMSLVGIPIRFVDGLVYGLAVSACGSLRLAIALHATSNAVVVWGIASMAGQAWFQRAANLPFTTAVCCSAAVLAYGLMVLILRKWAII